MEEILKLYAKSNGETIGEHTQKLLDDFEAFKSMYSSFFNEKTLQEIEYACKYHDYGKSAYVFQKKIKNMHCIDNIPKEKVKSIEKFYKDNGFEDNIPHGYVSPMFLPKDLCDNDMIKIVFSAIYRHHNRKVEIKNDVLKELAEKDILERYPDLKLNKRIYSKCQITQKKDSDWMKINWLEYVIVLGMLNKFDYHASDTDKNKLPLEIERKSNGKYLNEYVLDFFTSNKFKMNQCQEYAQQNTDKNIIIIASTGIGKTETALLWANGEKLFYTLPLKVSINAMYKRISNTYGYNRDKVTLLHSSALDELISENQDENESNVILKYDTTRRFSYPVTVCTVDQLFTFVYKYRGCEPIIATLKYSRIVIDEIQSYDPKIIARLVCGLKTIDEIGGKFALITATLPPFIIEQMEKAGISYNKPQKFLINDKIRHKIKIIDDDEFDFDEIAEKAETKKVLVICNTVKRACDVYSNLKDRCEYAKLLHSKFISNHRSMLEREILEFAENKEATGIWVSTQIVEASLDIDFDVLYSEMATADSLLQRMGRCYRKRDYSEEDDSNVLILDNKNGYKYIYDADIYDRSIEFLKEYDNNFFHESDKMDYIDNVYKTEEIKETKYYKSFMSNYDEIEHMSAYLYTKEQAKERFRDIQSFSVIPKEIYDIYVDEIDYAEKVISGKIKADKLQRAKQRIFLQGISTGISKYGKKSKNIVSMNLEKCGYYVILNKYDFNEETLTGIGLCDEIDDDENFF